MPVCSPGSPWSSSEVEVLRSTEIQKVSCQRQLHQLHCGSWWRIAAFTQVSLVCASVCGWCWWLWLCAETEEEFFLSWERLGAAPLPGVLALHAGFVFSFAGLTCVLPSGLGPPTWRSWGLPGLSGACKCSSQPQLDPLSTSRVHFGPSEGPSWALPQNLTHTISYICWLDLIATSVWAF